MTSHSSSDLSVGCSWDIESKLQRLPLLDGTAHSARKYGQHFIGACIHVLSRLGEF